MPRLAFINPWIYDYAAVNMWSKPLGLLQVAEFLSPYAQSLAWIDCMDDYHPGCYGVGKYTKVPVPVPDVLKDVPRRYGRYGISLERFREQLARALPLDVILMTSIMTYWYPGVQEAVRICKELAPHTPVILGGLYARLNPEHARRHSGADIVYPHAAGEKLLGLLSSLGLDITPQFPAQRFYELPLYNIWPYAPLLTSGGCPCACPYCASPQLQTRYTRRPAGETLRDIYALHALGATDFAFYDDALLYESATHLQPLLEALIRDPLPIRFHTPNGLHAAFLNARTARLMKDAQFKTLRLSLETADPARQSALGGKIDNPQFEQAVAHLLQAGFAGSDIGAYLMYGLYGQTWEEVCAGVDYLMQLGIKINLTEYSPIPGTPMWNDWMQSGRLPQELDPLLTNNSVFSWQFSEYPLEEILALKVDVAQHNQQLKGNEP
jgi:radical SAM superfamily enzyme YgiQ (UPF0313 family)